MVVNGELKKIETVNIVHGRKGWYSETSIKRTPN